MGTGTAATVSCLGDDGAGTDMIAFGDEGLGEVAIDDGEVAVTEGDIKTRTTASFLAQPCGVPWPVCVTVLNWAVTRFSCIWSYTKILLSLRYYYKHLYIICIST